MKFAAFLFLVALGARPLAAELPERVLAEVNAARTAPQTYAHTLLTNRSLPPSRAVADAVRFLQRARPLPALSLSSGLCQGASLQVADQGPKGGFGHSGSGWGNTPWSRMSQFGKWIGSAGENISYGQQTARGIVHSWIVDAGVAGKGHRKNLFGPAFGVAGIACGGHARYGAMCVMDFAGSYVEGSSSIARL